MTIFARRGIVKTPEPTLEGRFAAAESEVERSKAEIARVQGKLCEYQQRYALVLSPLGAILHLEVPNGRDRAQIEREVRGLWNEYNRLAQDFSATLGRWSALKGEFEQCHKQ